MDNSSVTVLGFQIEPERDSPQEPFLRKMMGLMKRNRKEVVIG